jgi:calcineurin-like phosphoesterase
VLVLVIGDVIGRPGRRAVARLMPGIIEKYGVDLVVANAENIAGGIGVTIATAQELLDAGVNVLTSGNHVWAEKEIIPHLDGDLPLLRPLNYPLGVPGRGYLVAGQAMVVNLIGRTFMGNFDCPFRAMDRLLGELETQPPVIIVDFHAEATSEKVPRGTAYVTDIGMTGPIDSIIGDDIEAVTRRFLTMIPHRLSVGKGKVVLNAVLLEVDEASGRALSIERIAQEVE